MGEMDVVKRAADYIRGGAKLTSKTCPICGFLLLQFDGKDYCSRCERQLIFTETKEEYVKLTSNLVLNRIEDVLIQMIDHLSNEIGSSPRDASTLNLLGQYLTLLEKIKNLQR